MSNVIKIENLYKEYRLGIIGYGTLYQDLQSWWAKMRGMPDPNSLIGEVNPNQGKERILALNDINLEVKDGEVLGIIGANGSGKSTLLKILSKVTAPTSGTINYNGRIASLLEVGTGFHPELTGRENIYLNGAINGMNNREVKRKLDEIVDFAGVGKFLDTPVKRYSSGMYVRLGFAVAAHLDPDILLVDEVLAVGDASFQDKAIRKMQSVSKDEGRTVLFVSHQMASIGKLCQTAIVLDAGKIVFSGDADKAISKYLQNASTHDSEVFFAKDESKITQIRSIRMLDYENNLTINIDRFHPFYAEISYDVYKRVENPFVVADLKTSEGIRICYSHSTDEDSNKSVILEPGSYVSIVEFPGGVFNSGTYTLDFALQTKYEKLDNIPTLLTFNLIDYGTFIVNHGKLKGRVILGLLLKWETERVK